MSRLFKQWILFIKFQTMDIIHPISNNGYYSPNFKQWILFTKFQTMDIFHQISNNGYYSSNFKQWILFIKFQTMDIIHQIFKQCSPGRIAQSVTCLTTDTSLTADPGVASSTPARSHTFVEIDHDIIAKVFLLPSAESFKKGCCQLQAKVCARNTD